MVDFVRSGRCGLLSSVMVCAIALDVDCKMVLLVLSQPVHLHPSINIETLIYGRKLVGFVKESSGN